MTLVSLEKYLRLLLQGFLVLYSIALLTSMAGMEIFGWGSALIVLLLISFSEQTRNLIKSVVLPVDFVLIALFVVIVIGVFTNSPETIDKVFVIGSARFIFLFFFLRMAITIVSPTNESWGKLMFVLIGLSAIIGLYAIFQFHTGIDLMRPGESRAVQLYGPRASGQMMYRSAGFFSSPMRYGYSVGMFFWLPVFAFFINRPLKSWQKILLISAIVLIFVSLITTLTRGVWLATLAAAIAALFLYKPKAAVIFMLSSMAFIGASILMFPTNVITRRFATIFDPTFASNSERLQLWATNFEIFKEFPFFGVGYGVNEFVIAQYYERLGIVNGMVGHAHNNYFQMLVGTGILGFVCYLLFIGFFLWLSFKLWKQIPPKSKWERSLVGAATVAQVFMHIGGLTECNFKGAEVNHLFMAILAIVSFLALKHQTFCWGWRRE